MHTTPMLILVEKDDVDVRNRNGEVESINAVDDDGNSVTSTYRSSYVDCDLDDEGDYVFLGDKSATVASVVGSDDHSYL